MKILIDTDWSMFLEDLPADKQLEFFWAVFDYGNRECSLKCWNKIKPILEKGKIGYYNKLKTLKHVGYKPIDTIVDTSIDTTTDTNVVSGSVSVRQSKKEKKENISSLRTTRVTPTEEEVLEYARQQDEMAGVGGFAVTQEQAQDFYDYYTGIGWALPNDAKTPIVDWKPFLRKWVRNPRYRNTQQEPEESSMDKYEFRCMFDDKEKEARK